MFNFNVPRYEKVVTDAINLRPQIEAAVDKICKEAQPTDDNGTIKTEAQPVIESIQIKD